MGLRFQLMQSLNFTSGTKKKSYYKDNGRYKKDKIFSFQEQKNLKDTASQFAKWMQQEHREVKRVRDISKDHVQEWLDSKNEYCNINTLEAYKNRLGKIACLCNKYYESCSLDWSELKKNVASESQLSKKRNLAFSEEEWELVLRTRKNKNCDSYKALKLAGITGQRVSSLSKYQVRDFDFKKSLITVYKAKGGRIWDIPMREEDITFLKELMKGLNTEESLINIQPKTINKYLSDACRELGLDKFPDHCTGIHAVRKMVAQREYNRLVSEGKSTNEAGEWVNEFLGHGKKRKSLIAIYVLDQEK